MLALTEVDHVNYVSYRECKAYLRCMKKIGLEVNTQFKYENIFTSCGSHNIRVLRGLSNTIDIAIHCNSYCSDINYCNDTNYCKHYFLRS